MVKYSSVYIKNATIQQVTVNVLNSYKNNKIGIQSENIRKYI